MFILIVRHWTVNLFNEALRFYGNFFMLQDFVETKVREKNYLLQTVCLNTDEKKMQIFQEKV